MKKIGMTGSLLLLCLVLVMFLSELGITQDSDLFIQAQKARQQGDMDSAYRLYEQAAEQGIRPHDAYFEMGLILLEKEKWTQAYRISGKAVKAFQEYLTLNPDDDNAWFRLAYTYENRSFAPGVNEWKKAIEALQKALSISLENPQYLLHLGYVYYKIGEREFAEEILLNLVNKYPDYVDARYYLAMNYLEKQDKEKAKQHFTYILENVNQENSYYQWAKKELNKIGGGTQ
ncbi:MAG: tetratricopeptide repeat protein [Candidatus Atribacteria bacterium]|nr:tetratricopeptide repeat protein [Candidatus Atribacteria bacterium]